jgi:excisionase family DNA binding protein
MQNTERIRELDSVAEEIRLLGAPELAEKVRQVADDLRQADQPAPQDLLTTGEAAELLGVQSINTIKHWVQEGLLDGYRRGGRILVTRASVQRMADAPAVAEQRAFERDLADALAPFESLPDEHLPTTATWEGRKPWEQHDGAAG